MNNCVRCKRTFEWGEVVELAGDVLTQADTWGVESLTEDEQLLYEGKLCPSCLSGDEPDGD